MIEQKAFGFDARCDKCGFSMDGLDCDFSQALQYLKEKNWHLFKSLVDHGENEDGVIKPMWKIFCPECL